MVGLASYLLADLVLNDVLEIHAEGTQKEEENVRLESTYDYLDCGC